jgi:hypothetical protein
MSTLWVGFIDGKAREGWMADGVNAFSHYDPGAFLLFPDGTVFYCEPRGDDDKRRVSRCAHTAPGFVEVAPRCVWYAVSGDVAAARTAAEVRRTPVAPLCVLLKLLQTSVGRKYARAVWLARQLRLKRESVKGTYPSEFVAAIVARACSSLPITCGRLSMERVHRALIPYGSAVEWDTFIVEQSQNVV